MLTVIRILLTPLFIIFMLKGMHLFALAAFSVAAVTDGLDGLWARCFNQRTLLGAYLDPIADKLLLTAAFISLAILKIIPAWLTVIVISRDVIIAVGIAVFELAGTDFAIRPSIASKCTTVAQSLSIFFTLLDYDVSNVLVVPVLIKKSLYWITAGLTIASGLHYIYTGMNILHNALGNNRD